MKTSETMAKIAPALAKALGEIHNATKDSKNPHFKNTYASLAAVIDATKATLADHGLVVVQSPGWNDNRVTVTTRIVHTSGEWIEATAEAPVPKADPQGVGSAVTYLRRYSLAAICGITQEDDDGETASRRSSPNKAVEEIMSRITIDEKQAHLLMRIKDAESEGKLDAKEIQQVKKAADTRDAELIERATRYVMERLAS
jgi:hypothetical protein